MITVREHSDTKADEDVDNRPIVKCDSMEAADAVKEAMKLQWSGLIMPGKEVKVKVTGCEEPSFAVVVECYYTSKLS